MPITERTLKMWRRDALEENQILNREVKESDSICMSRKDAITNCERILRMTQELLDQHELRKIKK